MTPPREAPAAAEEEETTPLEFSAFNFWRSPIATLPLESKPAPSPVPVRAPTAEAEEETTPLEFSAFTFWRVLPAAPPPAVIVPAAH